MRSVLKSVPLLLALLVISAQPAYSDEFGVVMDVSGKAAIHRGSKEIPADLGMSVHSEDKISVEKNSNIVIVSYKDCNEWSVPGPDTISISSDSISSSKNSNLSPSRQLPVCYEPEEYQGNSSDVLGGFVLRGAPKDPVAGLREEFKSGKASNSTLMTLIMHDLKNGNIKKARPYFEALKKHSPNSSFVKKIAKQFERQ